MIPVREGTAPEAYDAYVIGSAAYIFHWRKDARKFAELEPLIGPRDMRVFFGALIAERIRGKDRIITWMPATDDMPLGDFRDWAAVDEWAEAIGSELPQAHNG